MKLRISIEIETDGRESVVTYESPGGKITASGEMYPIDLAMCSETVKLWKDRIRDAEKRAVQTNEPSLAQTL